MTGKHFEIKKINTFTSIPSVKDWLSEALQKKEIIGKGTSEHQQVKGTTERAEIWIYTISFLFPKRLINHI
jgi:hypothetical protein